MGEQGERVKMEQNQEKKVEAGRKGGRLWKTEKWKNGENWGKKRKETEHK